MPFMFENLEVYQKAIACAEELGNLTEGFSTKSAWNKEEE